LEFEGTKGIPTVLDKVTAIFELFNSLIQSALPNDISTFVISMVQASAS